MSESWRVPQIEIKVFDRKSLDKDDPVLVDQLGETFELLDSLDWEASKTVGIAFDDNKPVGLIVGDQPFCSVLEVAPSYRRQGIGTQLVKITEMYRPKGVGNQGFWNKELRQDE